MNGLGLGHISRLISINRWLRRLAPLVGVDAEILFLTSSECDTIAYTNGFAAFKIPSKNSVREAGLTPVRYRRIAKQWIWNAVNLCAPDIFIVDTFPGGSFHELYDVFDLGSKNVFIYREVRPEAALKPEFQKTLSAFHALITTSESDDSQFFVPDHLAERVTPVGRILLREREELLPRQKARQILGLKPDGLVCYITAGGGGDPSIQEAFRDIVETVASHPDIQFVIGSGPLYRGYEYHAPNVRWFSRYNAIDYYNAFDMAISAGGYNTVNELLYCGLPTAFFAQQRMYDDQEKRIDAIAALGGCLYCHQTDGASVAGAIQTLRDPVRRAALQSAALRYIGKNYARSAAECILHLVADEIETERASALIPGSYLGAVRDMNIPERAAVALLYALDYNHRRNKRLKRAGATEGFEEPSGPALIYEDESTLWLTAVEYLKLLQEKGVAIQAGLTFLRAFIRHKADSEQTAGELMDELVASVQASRPLGGNTEGWMADRIEQYKHDTIQPKSGAVEP